MKDEIQVRDEIERLLAAAGWLVLDVNQANIQAVCGVAPETPAD